MNHRKKTFLESAKERMGRRADVVVILGVGLFLRLLFFFEPIRSDEGYTILNLAPKTIEWIRADYHEGGVNHILFSIMTHFLFYGLGHAHMETAVRLVPLLSGLAMIWLTFRLSLQWTEDARVACLAAFLVAVSKYLVFFSVNGRGYTLEGALCLLLSVYAFSQPADSIGPLHVSLAGILEALIVYTIPSGIIFDIPFHLWFTFRLLRSKNHARVRLTVLFLVMALLPGLLLMWPLLRDVHAYSSTSIGTWAWPEIKEVLLRLPEGLLPILVFYPLLIAGFFLHPQAFRYRPFLLWILVPYPLMAWMLNPALKWMVFMARHYSALFPFAYISVATAIVSLSYPKNRNYRPFKVLAVSCLILLVIYPAYSFSSVVSDPSRLYFPNRAISATCKERVPPLARSLQRGECIYGYGLECDLGAAFYTVKTRGFNGFYGLGKLDENQITRVYMVCSTPEDASQVAHSILSPPAWSRRFAYKPFGPLWLYRFDRTPLRRRFDTINQQIHTLSRVTEQGGSTSSK